MAKVQELSISTANTLYFLQDPKNSFFGVPFSSVISSDMIQCSRTSYTLVIIFIFPFFWWMSNSVKVQHCHLLCWSVNQITTTTVTNTGLFTLLCIMCSININISFFIQYHDSNHIMPHIIHNHFKTAMIASASEL